VCYLLADYSSLLPLFIYLVSAGFLFLLLKGNGGVFKEAFGSLVEVLASRRKMIF